MELLASLDTPTLAFVTGLAGFVASALSVAG